VIFVGFLFSIYIRIHAFVYITFGTTPETEAYVERVYVSGL
jgi:hypothetical protein